MAIFVFAIMILLQLVVGTMAMGAFFRYKDKAFLPAAIALYLMMFRRITALITWTHAPPSDAAASADLLVLPLCITLMICTAFLMSMRRDEKLNQAMDAVGVVSDNDFLDRLEDLRLVVNHGACDDCEFNKGCRPKG